MASCEAVVCALALLCVHQIDLMLKLKQEEALVYLYNSIDVLASISTEYQ